MKRVPSVSMEERADRQARQLELALILVVLAFIGLAAVRLATLANERVWRERVSRILRAGESATKQLVSSCRFLLPRELELAHREGGLSAAYRPTLYIYRCFDPTRTQSV